MVVIQCVCCRFGPGSGSASEVCGRRKPVENGAEHADTGPTAAPPGGRAGSRRRRPAGKGQEHVAMAERHPAETYVSLVLSRSLVCLVVCLFDCLSVCPSVRLSVCPSVRLSVCPSGRPAVRPPARLPACPPVRPFFCPSIRPPVIRPSAHPSIRPSEYRILSKIHHKF